MNARITTRCCYSKQGSKCGAPVVKCELCSLFVHTSCIGPVQIPFKCISCTLKNSPICVICKQKKGILKKIENTRSQSRKKEYIHIICGLMSDFASVIDWNVMTWAVDFNKLEEYESDNPGLICSICNNNCGALIGCEKCSKLAHPYCIYETRFEYRECNDNENDNNSEIDNDTQVFENDSQEIKTPNYWKIKTFNKVNVDIVGKDLREKLEFHKAIDFIEDDNSDSESNEDSIGNEDTKDSNSSIQQTEDAGQITNKVKENFLFEYKSNFWRRGGYISVRCPSHHLKRKFCSCNFNETEYDSCYGDDSDYQESQESADEDIIRKIDPNFLIFCDHCNIWYHGDCEKVHKDTIKELDIYQCRKCKSWSKFKTTVLRDMLSNCDELDSCKLVFPKKPYNFQLVDYIECAKALFCKSLILIGKKKKSSVNPKLIIDFLKNLERIPFCFDKLHEALIFKLKNAESQERESLEELKNYEHNKVLGTVLDENLNSKKEQLLQNRNIFINLKYLVDAYRSNQIIKPKKKSMHLQNSLKIMKLLALTEKMRDILIFGEEYSIQDLTDAYNQIVDYYFIDNHELTKLTEETRNDFIKIIGSIINNYEQWREDILDKIKYLSAKVIKIKEKYDECRIFRIDQEDFKSLSLNEKIDTCSKLFIKWKKLIDVKIQFNEIIQHFDEKKCVLMINIEDERELFLQLFNHMDDWRNRYQSLKKSNVTDFEYLIKLQELLEEAIEAMICIFPELIEAFDDYKIRLNTYLQFDHFINNRVSLDELDEFIGSFLKTNKKIDPNIIGNLREKHEKGLELLEDLEQNTKSINDLERFQTRIIDKINGDKNSEQISYYVIDKTLKNAIQHKLKLLKCINAIVNKTPVDLEMTELYQSLKILGLKSYEKYCSPEIIVTYEKKLEESSKLSFELTKLIASESKLDTKRFLGKLMRLEERFYNSGIMFKKIHNIIKEWFQSKRYERKILSEMQGFDAHNIDYNDLIICLGEEKINDYKEYLKEKEIANVRGVLANKLLDLVQTACWIIKYKQYMSRKGSKDRCLMNKLKRQAIGKLCITKTPEYAKFIKEEEQLNAYDHFSALSYDKSQIQWILDEKSKLSHDIKYSLQMMKAEKKNEQNLIKKIDWVDLLNRLQTEIAGPSAKRKKKEHKKKKENEEDILLDCNQIEAIKCVMGDI